MNDSTTLRMSGIVSNKHKQTVGYVYPSVRYLCRPLKTTLEGGLSFGSITKRFVGFSRCYSARHTYGMSVESSSVSNELAVNASTRLRIPS